jgi:hypothetical protein
VQFESLEDVKSWLSIAMTMLQMLFYERFRSGSSAMSLSNPTLSCGEKREVESRDVCAFRFREQMF